jgi:catechol 2,3-dioxygenase-like lactoylglutathione lyase family enzyme
VLDHFDHVTIAVRSLDAALDAYRRLLGAEPVWRGGHPELGTRAALFSLPNALVELVAPREGAEEAQGLHALLEARGEGLQAIAFGTQDAAALSAALRQKGVRATPPQDGTAHTDGGGTRGYRTVELAPRATRGLSVFAVERADVAALREAATPPAPSCADALDHVVVRTADPDAAIALYRDALGIRLALDRTLGGRRMLFFRVGGVTLEVVHDPSLGAHDVFYGAAYRVRDIDAAHARLRAQGRDVSEVRAGNKPGTHVFSVRDGTCGVPTLILRDPARDT